MARALRGFWGDINRGYEEALRYPLIDRISTRLLWWHFGIFCCFAFLNSYLRLASVVQSPFSWRVIPGHEALIALTIAFFATAIPVLLEGRLKTHYVYRLILCLSLTAFSYLYVFITGGAIEAHFHFFIALIFLAAYADWRLPWVVFSASVILNTVFDIYQPHWVFFYGQNLVSPIAHALPLLVAAILTTVLTRKQRDSLITLRDLEARREEFISMAAHELKTPVTSITIFAEVVERELGKRGISEFDEPFQKIREQLGKLTKLVKDLLDVSRIQALKLSYSFASFDFDDLARDIVATMSRFDSRRSIAIHGSGGRIIGDRDRLGQVLTNLIQNAIKYSPPGERIDVALARSADGLTVTVQDYGAGIDERHHQKIFERFYRVYEDNERTFPGMGIGLYISSEIVKRHAGRMWVESQKGKGSAFHFFLPFTDAQTLLRHS